MPLTIAGRDFIARSIAGVSQTAFNAANAHIGVGDGTAAFVNTQTDLQGTNRTRQPMDSGFPVQTVGLPNRYVYQATFGATQANFAWQEAALFNAATGGVMLNRLLSNQGVKVSGQVWTAELRIDVVI